MPTRCPALECCRPPAACPRWTSCAGCGLHPRQHDPQWIDTPAHSRETQNPHCDPKPPGDAFSLQHHNLPTGSCQLQRRSQAGQSCADDADIRTTVCSHDMNRLFRQATAVPGIDHGIGSTLSGELTDARRMAHQRPTSGCVPAFTRRLCGTVSGQAGYYHSEFVAAAP